MHIPLAFGLIGAGGTRPAVSAASKAPRSRTASSTAQAPPCDPLPRRCRAAGRCRSTAAFPRRSRSAIEQSTASTAFLARHDSDLFSRWQALNTLLTEALIAGFARCRGGKQPDFADRHRRPGRRDRRRRDAGAGLPGAGAGPARRGRHRPRDRPPTSIRTRSSARARRCARRSPRPMPQLFDRLWRPLGGSGDSARTRRVPGGGPCATRCSTCLGAGRHRPLRAAEAFPPRDQHDRPRRPRSPSWRNRFAGRAETAAALAAFEQRYRDDPLVLDKWFPLQATAPGPAGGRPRRGADAATPAFSIANPNRVRALIGTFSHANQTGFHRRDGAGYALFARRGADVEERNPQVAARLATALRSWRSLEPERQGKAREAPAGDRRAEGPLRRLCATSSSARSADPREPFAQPVHLTSRDSLHLICCYRFFGCAAFPDLDKEPEIGREP